MNKKLVLELCTFILLSCSLLHAKFNSLEAKASIDYSAQNINTDTEYSNGTIPTAIGGIWYSWINTSKSQVIYYSLFSNEVNSPIMNFLGQHFEVEDSTDVFVGNTLTLIEVYNDTNADGIPQANFTSGESELAYYLLVNSSIGYEITPIQKIMKGEIPHYTFGFKYNMIDGFLLYPEQHPGQGAARVMINHLGFKYDFYIAENISYMKTSFDIGNITDIEPFWGQPPVSLDGLSLSLLFSTVTSSAEQHTAYVNGQSYNSTTAANAATAISSGELAVKTIKAYEFRFAERYNLTRGESIETHDVESEAAATTSVPEGARSRLEWIVSYFEDHLNMSELFPSATGISGKLNLDYNASAFLYRICYPVWDGLPIQHDPEYVAYLFSYIPIPEFPTFLILPLLMITTLLVLISKKRKARFLPHMAR